MSAPRAITSRLLTPSVQPLLWHMLYLALYVPDGAARLPRGIVRSS